jgi:16S rRNA (guanine527-N7)-methyltransferase
MSGEESPRPPPRGPELSEDLERRLSRYAEELAAWGSRTNLVGSTAPEAIRLHVEEALAAVPALPQGALVADLGSGAGLPGLPIAIARPDLRVTLVEIRERRVHFLRHVARSLPVDCRILRLRIEDPPPGAAFDVALLRAVAGPLDSLRMGRPWVREGGEIWTWTRARLGDLPPEMRAGASEIPLGERGRILRVAASHVPRGTPG